VAQFFLTHSVYTVEILLLSVSFITLVFLDRNNRLYSTPDTPQAGVQRHHTGMRGAGVELK